ncbi:MAG: S8 family serine peptidase [Alphaproteobacteria bacterium]|nr:S8 family serine peptidase [Alphaproteobacteria bacterium]
MRRLNNFTHLNDLMKLLFSAAVLLLTFTCLSHGAQALERGKLAGMLQAACRSPEAPTRELTKLIGQTVTVVEPGSGAGLAQRQISFSVEEGGEVSILLSVSNGQLRRASLSYAQRHGGRPHPVLSIRTDPSCDIASGRLIEFDAAGRAQWLVHLDETLAPTDRREPLNPAVPNGADPGGVTVAQIDSGVNYTLPAITARLARSREGKLVGYDFWDMDERPFDVDAARSPFFPLHHGTLVASVLVREAPELRLIPYRYPRPDMSRMPQVLEHAAANGAKIVAMPLGSNAESQWTAFKQAAAKHADILFVVSAGNNGRNIDEQPVYPASFGLENVLVVTSSTISGRLAPGSNWGANSVDLMVPAERVEVTDHRGARGHASGSSYAVPRVAALAARLLAQNPKWSAPELKAAIQKLTGPSFERSGPKVRWGWIPNPADDG